MLSKWGQELKQNKNIWAKQIAESELARTFESKNHIKFKTIRHAQMTELWKMDSFGKQYHSWMLAESVSVLSSFKCSPMTMCLKKMLNGELICHLKRRLKRLCYYK